MKKFFLLLSILSACGGPSARGPLPQGPTTTVFEGSAPIAPADAADSIIPPVWTQVAPQVTSVAPCGSCEEAPALTTTITTIRATTTTLKVDNSPTERYDFWYALADCESNLIDPNYFQFMGSTGDKAGYVPGSSYESQKAAAQRWAAMIHPNEGTNAGWPNCWWIAAAKF